MGKSTSGCSGEVYKVSDDPQIDTACQRSWLYYEDPMLIVKKDGPPPKPYDNCPELRVKAEAACPKGSVHAGCVADVGLTCDLDRMVKAANDAKAELNAVAVINAPTETTTTTSPDGTKMTTIT